MSDLRIALVAEGKTDQIVIEAALKAILKVPFVLTLVQPETSDWSGGAGPLGGGWGGVYRWCRQLVSMSDPVGENPSLAGFDLLLLHVDVDVAGERYENANIHDGRTDLPCRRPCPPVEDSVNALRDVMAGWLDLATTYNLPGRWVFCIPSQCVEAWIVAVLYSTSHPAMMTQIECNMGLENWLSQRPRTEGQLIRSGKKQPSAYQRIARQITANWEAVMTYCSQAVRFSDEVQAAVQMG